MPKVVAEREIKVVAEREIADARFGPGYERMRALNEIRVLTDDIGRHQKKLEEADTALEPYRALMKTQVVPAVLEHAIDVSCIDWKHYTGGFTVRVDPDDVRQGSIAVTRSYYSMTPEEIAKHVGSSLRSVLGVFGFDGWDVSSVGADVFVRVK